MHLWGFMSVCALSLSVVPTLRKMDQYYKAIILLLKINLKKSSAKDLGKTPLPLHPPFPNLPNF